MQAPIWASPSYKHSVLGSSLTGGAPPPPPTTTVPSDAFSVVVRQLQAAGRWNALPEAIRRTMETCASSFSGSIDLLQPAADASKDGQSAIAFITQLVSRLKALGGGQALVVVRRVDEAAAATEGRTYFVVHRRRASSDFCVAVCTSATAAAACHPTRVDPASGSLQQASPLLLRDVAAHRVCDGAFWYLALLASRKALGVQTIFERLLPVLNCKPLLANWAALSGDGAPPSAAGGRLGTPAQPQWRSEAARADPHGFDLATTAAIAALQLVAEEDPAVASADDASGATHTAAGLEALLQHMLLLCVHQDLERLGHTQPHAPPLPVATVELLTRASRRCSLSTGARVSGALTLSAAELRQMQADVATLKGSLGVLRAASVPVQSALAPPEAVELLGSPRLPNFGRLLEVAPVDGLAGTRVERPLVMPIELSRVPDAVSTIGDASNALQHACYCCTLLSNQHGLVRDSFALRIGLLTHLFLRVLPHPLPPAPPPALPPTLEGAPRAAAGGEAAETATCFWAHAPLTSDSQAALLRWLGTLCRHFAAASLSVPLGRSFDAARMLVFAAIAAIVDAVLRVRAVDAPTALSLHYGGHVEGAAGGFALDMRLLEKESERGQLLQPCFAAARTMLLDYFRAVAASAPPERHVFRWDRSMDFGVAEHALVCQLALHLGFPRDEASLRAYLSGEDARLVDLLPELATLRDVRRHDSILRPLASSALPLPTPCLPAPHPEVVRSRPLLISTPP